MLNLGSLLGDFLGAALQPALLKWPWFLGEQERLQHRPCCPQWCLGLNSHKTWLSIISTGIKILKVTILELMVVQKPSLSETSVRGTSSAVRWPDFGKLLLISCCHQTEPYSECRFPHPSWQPGPLGQGQHKSRNWTFPFSLSTALRDLPRKLHPRHLHFQEMFGFATRCSLPVAHA